MQRQGAWWLFGDGRQCIPKVLVLAKHRIDMLRYSSEHLQALRMAKS